MAKELPNDIKRDLKRAYSLHKRATSDYKKCLEFNKLMSELLARAEDTDCDRLADRIMTILLECNPKEGTSCEKATLIGEKIKKMVPLAVK